MILFHRKLIFIGLLLCFPILLGASCGGKPPTLDPVKLTIWRVWDEEDAFKEIISNYRASHPNVTIEYKKLRYEEYRDQLLSAWARGEGPDIFSVPNSWVGEYLEFGAPLPASLSIPRIETRTVLGFKKEKRLVTDSTRTYTPESMKSIFLPTVVDDVIYYDEDRVAQIYGLPLAIDDLALFYNRDLLDQAGIPLPPKTWKDLLAQIPNLVKENTKGELVQSGVALGTTSNVQRYFDILSLLMMQDGAEMGTIDNKNLFTTTISKSIKDANDESFAPGPHALGFYSDFANPSKQAYSWNEDLPDDFEAFTQGQLAYFFGYSYHLPLIREAAPRLNFSVAPMPQVSLNQTTNYSNYWVEMVYQNSKNATWAWDFIFFATKDEAVQSYINKTIRPSARRELIAAQAEQDPTISVFVDQALTSSSWYHGRNYAKAEEALTTMINSFLSNETTAKEAVNLAEQMINQNERLKE